MIQYDGDGHQVTGLWANNVNDENTGLFAMLVNGTIKNLKVKTYNGKKVKGMNSTGLLIGKMVNGVVDNCHVEGCLEGIYLVGGIVGEADGGRIIRSQANVDIKTTGKNAYVGGLIGDGNVEIDQCVTSGSLIADGEKSYVAGIIGKNKGKISNSYSRTNNISTYCAAGLVGYNLGTIEKSYASGNVLSKNYGAGVVGYNDGSSASVHRCVAMNIIIDVTYESQSAQGGGYGQRIIGGFKNGAPAPEMDNYALRDMQISLNGIPQKVYDDIMNGASKYSSELVMATTYQQLNWDFSYIWQIDGWSYPSLRNNPADVDPPCS